MSIRHARHGTGQIRRLDPATPTSHCNFVPSLRCLFLQNGAGLDVEMPGIEWQAPQLFSLPAQSE